MHTDNLCPASGGIVTFYDTETSGQKGGNYMSIRITCVRHQKGVQLGERERLPHADSESCDSEQFVVTKLRKRSYVQELFTITRETVTRENQ